jgi:hypothetical protein
MSGIYTFFGVDHKCGTSMVCQSVAECIARAVPEWNILLIHTEGDPGTGYASGSGESTERIRPGLSEGLFDPQEVMARSKWKGNLHFIAGADPLEGEGKYHPNLSDTLLRHLKGCFDLILCDSGSQIEHGLALGSLFAADGIFLVMVQAEGAVRRFERLIHLYLKLNVPTMGCLINRFREKNPYTPAYLRERLDRFPADFYTVGESALGPLAEAEGRSLFQYRDRMYGKDVRHIASLILSDAGRGPIPEKERSAWSLMKFRNISKAEA